MVASQEIKTTSILQEVIRVNKSRLKIKTTVLCSLTNTGKKMFSLRKQLKYPKTFFGKPTVEKRDATNVKSWGILEVVCVRFQNNPDVSALNKRTNNVEGNNCIHEEDSSDKTV